MITYPFPFPFPFPASWPVGLQPTIEVKNRSALFQTEGHPIERRVSHDPECSLAIPFGNGNGYGNVHGWTKLTVYQTLTPNFESM